MTLLDQPYSRTMHADTVLCTTAIARMRHQVLALSVSVLLLGVSSLAGCIHDQVVLRRINIAPQQYGHRRSPDWQSIRIELDYSGIDIAIPNLQRAYIKAIVSDAREWLQASLHVERVRGNLLLADWRTDEERQAGHGFCGDQVDLPTAYTELGQGVSADLVIFVMSQQTIECAPRASGNWVAYASHCQQDTYHRPIAGFIQLCPQHFGVKQDPSAVEHDVNTALHEMFHVLGFTREFLMPRTHIEDQDKTSAKPRILLQTPSVLAHARAHFGCPTLAGVGLTSDWYHWDAEDMRTDFMTAARDRASQVRSSLTLALLEDLGWYQVNYSQADILHWGFRKGCNFVTSGSSSSSIVGNILAVAFLICCTFFVVSASCLFAPKCSHTTSSNESHQPP